MYTEKQRLEAVQTYAVTGNMALTGAMLKIDVGTLHGWKRQPWWKEFEDNLRLEDNIEISGRLRKIMSKTLDVVEDRLENGDYVYDQKSGSMRRKPVSMRDAAKVFSDSTTERQTLLDKTSSSESVEAVGDKLLKLADKFAMLAGKRTLELNTFEGQVHEVAQTDGTPSDVWDGGGPTGSDQAVQTEADSQTS